MEMSNTDGRLVIVTKRLRLRSFRDEDWSAVHAYTIDPETVRYVPGELPSEEETQLILSCRLKRRTDETGYSI
jgi:hypothetical protein